VKNLKYPHVLTLKGTNGVTLHQRTCENTLLKYNSVSASISVIEFVGSKGKRLVVLPVIGIINNGVCRKVENLDCIIYIYTYLVYV
jgi:hypothetical protein